MMNVREYPSLQSKGRGIASSLEVAVFASADYRKTDGFLAGYRLKTCIFLSSTVFVLSD